MSLVSDAVAAKAHRLPGITADGPQLLPLDAGEQYRFSFAMDACIGCHSCEVACAEQNANPVGVNWRRVGEVEGGTYPTTRRYNLSMACNHCLDPSCLSGCPTNAYVKLDNGVVKHLADECIGCQYCIWNCPYEVPVFNPERGIVTKCDMCLPRLEAGQLPACVLACPTTAITIEKVSVAAWKADHSDADAPGLPPASITTSTTRVVLAAGVTRETIAVSDEKVEPADPHWPLVALTLLTQVAVGAVAATVGLEVLARLEHPLVATRNVLAGGAMAAFGSGVLALTASVLHLGRPAHAWKAVRNLRRSWLSREVVLFSAFSAASFAYCGAWIERWPTLAIGALSVAVGLVGVYASGRLYLVPARPTWNSPRTLVSFFATAASAGPLVAVLSVQRSALPPAWSKGLLLLGLCGTVGQLATYQHLAVSVVARSEREYRGTARLLFRRFRGRFALRVGLGLVAITLLVAALIDRGAGDASGWLTAGALACVATGELLGRWLFFVTVVPMTTAGTYFRGRA